MTTRIYVNPHIIQRNRTHGERKPAVVISRSGVEETCRSAEIVEGERVLAKLVYDPEKNARKCWIETECEVRSRA